MNAERIQAIEQARRLYEADGIQRVVIQTTTGLDMPNGLRLLSIDYLVVPAAQGGPAASEKRASRSVLRLTQEKGRSIYNLQHDRR